MPGSFEAEVGAKLRAARVARRLTLSRLSQETGISLSTLSRLESGKRKITMELLVPIARSLGVSIDRLVGRGGTPDPRVTRPPTVRDGVMIVQLSGPDSATQVFHRTIPAGHHSQPRLQSHDGYEWVFVVRGRSA